MPNVDSLKSSAKKDTRETPQEEIPQDTYNHQLLLNLSVGDVVAGIYLLESRDSKKATNGNKYTDFILRDRSGTFGGRMWKDFEVKTGLPCFIGINGTVKDYKGKADIIIENAFILTEEEKKDIDVKNYVAIFEEKERSLQTIDQFISDVCSLCGEASDNTCKIILDEVFSQYNKEDVFDSPYGILPYYGCNGGLAGHTANVLKMAEGISNTFSISDEIRAILFTATILHGIGSTLAYSIDNFVSVESREGVLLGVTNLSLKIVAKSIDGASNINEETALRVLHSIASHNGYASIKPATKEAVILKKAHQSDYSVVQVFDYIEQDDTKGDFTSYDRISNQRYLKD